jgi:N-acetylglucosaminyldiphosphoundecaprenol N-acetyl-beta-D-mannosaminyltransferase
MSAHPIFSVPIDGLSLEETLQRILTSSIPVWIVTANPEILLEAKRNRAYADVLRRATFRLVDGFGLWMVLRFFEHKTTRVTGVELAEALCQLAVRHDWNVGLIGGAPDVAETAAAELIRTYQNLRVFAKQGGNVSADGTDDGAGSDARMRMAAFAPKVLLVAFGHPKQEMWIAKHLVEFPSIKVVVGVGGTFDIWAGKIQRAPRAVRAIGFEWFWRLVLEPKRWKRILNALVVFPVVAILEDCKKRKTS